MHHVIIGAGPAAVSAAEHIKKLDARSEVTMLAAEDVPPYSRMAIPYYLVGNISQEGTYLRKNSDHFDKLGINIRHGRATSINPQAKEVKLADGAGSVSYDRLLVATGATATKPPIPGIDLDSVHNCWSLADAHKIIDKANPGSNVVLMGAGFIGCIILESLAARKVNLTVIEMENRMVSRMTNRVMGTMIKDWCEDQGIRVLTSTKVDRIDSSDNGLTVSTNTGESIAANLVICATGVRSNTAFLEGSGINVDMGVVVDDYMQTSVADIYAAGDVAQGKDFSTGDYYVQAIQPTAVEHGKIAAQSMVLGHVTANPGNVNMNVLDTVGLISTSFGMWMGVDGGDESELVDKENYQYINLQFKDDVLVGASSLGMTQHVGVMRGLIQTAAPLGDWKDKLMENPTRLSEAYLAGAQGQHQATQA